MKAVIVEIKGRDVAALTNEGCIIKIKNEDYSVGQVVEIKAKASKKTAKIIAWAASAAAAIVVIGVSSWAYLSPYTYVSLDVNPSIEYSVNRFDRVLSVSAVNGDGAEILNQLDLRNQTIDQAVKNTVDKIKKAGYFEGSDPGGIEISTSSENQQTAENLAKELKTTALQETEGTASPVEVEAISVAHQRVLDAKALGTTPGKLNLVQKLQESMADPNSIDVKEWLNKPIKTIRNAIKENKKTEGNPSSSVDKKKESDGSSSSEVIKANSKAASSVQQSSKAPERDSQSQSGKKSEKSNGNSSATSKVIGNQSSANNGNNGTDKKDRKSDSEQGTTNSASSDSSSKKTKNENQNQNQNQNQGNSKSNADKNANNKGNANTKSK